MEPDHQRWVDSPEFDWTPETPLPAPSKAKSWFPRPKQEPPRDQRPANDPLPAPAKTKSWRPRAKQVPPRDRRPANNALRQTAEAKTWRPHPKQEPARDRRPISVALPKAANSNRAEAVLLPRLLFGLLQGLSLAALFQTRDFGQLPGSNPALFASLAMALMFAPLLLIQGLGRVPLKPLLLWTLFGALSLGGLGFYHQWRTAGADASHAGLWLAAMAAIFFFIGQVLLLGASRPTPERLRYIVLQESAWQLAIEIMLCALAGSAAWVMWAAADGWLRIKYPALPLNAITMPMVTSAVALAAQCCGTGLLRPLEQGLKFVLTALLPLGILFATLTTLVGGFAQWHPPLAFLVAQILLLILALNASYRSGGDWRPLWRRRCEFAGAFLLIPLAVLAALSLEIRIAEYGFTAPRIVAMATLLLAGSYALAYVGAALISLGGGPWMARLEGANVLMAFVTLSLIATLASPLADPVHLSVLSQNWRLAHGKVAPELFDYAYLRNGGLRFGHDDLIRMTTQTQSPAVSQGAFLALAADPVTETEQASPAEIGANIRVMTPGARLPANLIGRDWSSAGTGVPPCLTSARLGCDAYFADLAGDGDREIMLTFGGDSAWWAAVMRQGLGGGWYVAGSVASPPCPGSLAALRAGQFTIAEPLPHWRDLVVQGEHLAVSLIAHSRPSCK